MSLNVPSLRYLGVVTVGIVAITLVCFKRGEPKSIRTPANAAALPPELVFLIDEVKQSEDLLRRVQVNFTVRSQVTGSSRDRPFKAYTSMDYVWAVRNDDVRFDSRPSGKQAGPVTRFVSTAEGQKEWHGESQENGTVVPKGITIPGDDHPLKDSAQYLELGRLWLDGAALSSVLERRGVSAARDGDVWKVRLRSSNRRDPREYEEAVLAPHRGYRIQEWARFDGSGNRLRRAVVTRWERKKEENPWLPARVEWTLQSNLRGTKVCAVTGVRFDAEVDDALFSIPDDGKLTIVDRRINRVVRDGTMDQVPLTPERLEATYRAIAAELPRSSSTSEPGVLHDNGARTAPEDCGLQCVWLVARLKDRPVDWKLLKSRYPSPDGKHDMAQLQDAASWCRTSLVGLQVPLRAIEQLRTPAIAFIQPGHFCVVVKQDRDMLYVYDPPAKFLRLPRRRLLPEVWGQGYVLAPASTHAARGPEL